MNSSKERVKKKLYYRINEIKKEIQ